MNNKWGKFLLVFGLMSLAFILLAVLITQEILEKTK